MSWCLQIITPHLVVVDYQYSNFNQDSLRSPSVKKRMERKPWSRPVYVWFKVFPSKAAKFSANLQIQPFRFIWQHVEAFRIQCFSLWRFVGSEVQSVVKHASSTGIAVIDAASTNHHARWQSFWDHIAPKDTIIYTRSKDLWTPVAICITLTLKRTWSKTHVWSFTRCYLWSASFVVIAVQMAAGRQRMIGCSTTNQVELEGITDCSLTETLHYLKWHFD